MPAKKPPVNVKPAPSIQTTTYTETGISSKYISGTDIQSKSGIVSVASSKTGIKGKDKKGKKKKQWTQYKQNITREKNAFADLEGLIKETEEDYEDDAEIQKQKYTYAKHIYDGFKPIRLMLIALGRWPLESTLNTDGTRNYNWVWGSPAGVYFCIVSFLVFYVLIVGTLNIILISSANDTKDFIEGKTSFSSNIPLEKFLLQRHLIFFLVIWSSLIHAAIGSVNFLSKRNYFAFYFTFWSKALPAMLINVASNTLRTSLMLVGAYAASIVSIVFMSIAHLTPSSVSAPTLFGMLMFRGAYGDLYAVELMQEVPSTTTTTPAPDGDDGDDTSNSNITTTTSAPIIMLKDITEKNAASLNCVTLFGALFLIIVYAASKCYMFVFIYKCKILKNAFAQWNSRAYVSILRGDLDNSFDFGKSTFTLLFRDHCVLLDLIEGTDQLFSTVMESYFALQLCSICFEMYLFLRTGRMGIDRNKAYAEGFYIRPNEWVIAIIVFVQSTALLYLVATYAAEVGEEAMAGMEVLRRRSMIGRKSNDEYYFMLTMFVSYTAYKRLELSGGGFFYLNKELIIGIGSTVLSYFIILYQFQPKLDQNSVMKDKGFLERQIFGGYLEKLEGLEPQHFNTEPPSMIA